MLHFLAHFFGLDNLSGPNYGFFSGVGSDIGELAILGFLWHKFKCHVTGCYRVALHGVEGTTYSTCKKHHPVIGGDITAAHIKKVHAEAQADLAQETLELAKAIHKKVMGDKRPLGGPR